MVSYSPNMLKTFKSCPKKYWFKYIQKISVPQKTGFFEKGKKVHALANYYLRGYDITKLENALNKDEQIAWANLKNNEFFNMKYLNSEYNLFCKIDPYWIGGRLDAVVTNSEKIYILDYKTGSIPETPKYDYQTIVYLLCLKQKYPEAEIKFAYIDLKNNENCIINFKDHDEYKKAILEICSEIENGIYTKKRSNKCNFCEYQKICKNYNN